MAAGRFYARCQSGQIVTLPKPGAPGFVSGITRNLNLRFSNLWMLLDHRRITYYRRKNFWRRRKSKTTKISYSFPSSQSPPYPWPSTSFIPGEPRIPDFVMLPIAVHLQPDVRSEPIPNKER